MKLKFGIILAAVCIVFCFASCERNLQIDEPEKVYVDKNYVNAVTFEVSKTDTEGELCIKMSTTTQDAQIYYTTDKTTPTTSSTKYTGEGITVIQDTFFTAVAIKEGLEDSPISYANVSINEKRVVEVQPQKDTTNPDNVTNLQSEIYEKCVRLTWTESTSSDVFGYEVSYDNTAAINRAVITAIPKTSMIVAKGAGGCYISGLTNGNEYNFTVKTMDTSENKSSGVTIKAKPMALYKFHETVEYIQTGTYNGTAGNDAIYATFGDFPQSVLPETSAIEIKKNQTMTMGGFTYYMGTDGNWYVECQEKPWSANMNSSSYTDGSVIHTTSQNKKRYFKVEPLKWRVLNTDASISQEKILVSEYVLIGNIPYYGGTEDRILNSTKIKPSNYKYSNVRAYLNGIDNEYVRDGGTRNSYTENWSGKGFVSSAFTSSAFARISINTVDNSITSVNPYPSPTTWTDIPVCDNTSDRCFLLSQYEITNPDYGFEKFYETDYTRKRTATDYAIANGAHTRGTGSKYLLRSAMTDSSVAILDDGNHTTNNSGDVTIAYYGIVPVLRVKF